MKFRKILTAHVVTALAVGCTMLPISHSASAAGGDTLKTVTDRGHLLCSGHNGSFPAFRPGH